MSLSVLVINSGSSSIKFCLFKEQDGQLQTVNNGSISNIGSETLFRSECNGIRDSNNLFDVSNHDDALLYLLNFLESKINSKKEFIVGHRVVHGGIKYNAPTIITNEIVTELETYTCLAPLHQQYNLKAIKVISELDKSLTQIACFDTAFHAEHQYLINQYAIPEKFYKEGIRRYGFHGLSYEYIASKLKENYSELYNGKVIVAHLGNGASLCAIHKGKSIDSSMGFSALDGLMMGTRCGSIDAGVVLYMLQQKKMDVQQVSDLLFFQSGLLGVSGTSNNMPDLLESNHQSAKNAIELYVHMIIKEIGSLLSVLQGLNGIIFTGGIGENEDEIRARVCHELQWLGVTIDSELNKKSCSVFSTDSSSVKALVIKTNEELMIARHVLRLFGSS